MPSIFDDMHLLKSNNDGELDPGNDFERSDRAEWYYYLGDLWKDALRTRLLFLVSRGRIPPEMAEKYANSYDLGMFSYVPDPLSFDLDWFPWNIEMVVAWIVHRNAINTLRHRKDYYQQCRIWVRNGPPPRHDPFSGARKDGWGYVLEDLRATNLTESFRTLDGGWSRLNMPSEGLLELWKSLAQDKITAVGRLREGGSLDGISASHWLHMRPMVDATGVTTLSDGEHVYIDVRFRADEILNEWSAHKSDSTVDLPPTTNATR